MSKIPSPVGYVLVEKLGSGSYATVYKCYHKVSALYNILIFYEYIIILSYYIISF